MRALLAAVLMAGFAASALAQSVVLSGVSGQRALLVVDGGKPRFVAVGQVHQGVRVVSVQGEVAVLEFGGRRQTLRVGDAPLSVASAADAPATESARVVLTADTAGHFMPEGQINGRAVQFMVDTGASQVIISESEADRLNIKFQNGTPVKVSTANGEVLGRRLKLDWVRVGEAKVYGVDAIVLPQPMPFVLLGNSFLTRFQMKRTNDQLVLERRY